MPVSGCGCIVPDPEGAILTELGPVQTGFTELGRVACTCQVIEEIVYEEGEDPRRVLSNVEYVEVDPETCTPVMNAQGCQVDWDCPPTLDPETGDWIPSVRPAQSTTAGASGCPEVPERPTAVLCDPAGGGELRAYVSAARRGEVALLDLSDDETIEDVDRSIPGNTSIFVDDVITDVETHPRGDFIFTVNSTTASLTVIREDSLLPSHTVELGVTAPLVEALVTPSATAPLTAAWWQAPALAYISAPRAGEVLVVDLDALGDPAATADSVIIDRLVLSSEGAIPGALAADDAGLYVAVGHLDEAAVTLIDRADPTRQQRIALEPSSCESGYFTEVIEDLVDAGLCADGIDNDGDGLIDAEDPECAAGMAWEGAPAAYAEDARRLRCPQRYECFDGVDNDGDGLIDAEDEDCADAPRWERPTPACSDGMDNDGDGLIDAADPQCLNESDSSESDREVSTCADGIDNDGDGLIDAEDEDCVVDPACAIVATGEPPAGCPPSPLALPEEGDAADAPCRDEVDNDGDGLTDAEDPGCRDLAAAQRFGFERVAECADGVDNDGDGLIDFGPDGDPDCYAAADDNEGGQGARLGPSELWAPLIVADGALRQMIYALDRTTGDLYRISAPLDPAALGEGPLQTTRLRLGLDLQRGALRQIPGEADALLAVDDSGVLRSVEITDRVPLTDQAGRPIHARLAAYRRDDEALILSGQYYVIEDSVAYCVQYCTEQTLRPGVEASSCPEAEDLERCTGPDGEPHPLYTLAVSSQTLPLFPDSLQLPVEISAEARADLRSLVPEGDGLGVTVPLLDAENPDADRDRGFRDPMMIVSGARRLLEDVANVTTTAQGRANLVSTAPTFRLEGSSVRYERLRHPTFCRLEGDEIAAEPVVGDARTEADLLQAGPCVPIGFEADGGEEALQSARDRTQFRVDVYEGIQVLEEDSARFPSDEFTVAYEGVLPGSDSRSGQYGPPYISALDPAAETADTWTLLDYNRDLCEIGAQVGDVVLVEQMVPASAEAAQIPACATLYAQLAAEPLRYRVLEVGEHRMILSPDDRVDYAPQVPRDERSTLATLEPVVGVPPYECAAQFIQYQVRASDNQWLLTGARTGYRHPIVNVGGQCVVDAERLAAGRHSRTYLGDLFENEWFRFRLGYLAAGDDVISGVPEGRLPHMVEASFTFSTRAGRVVRSAQIVDGVAQEMRWMPLDDHLYVVDSTIGSVAEVVGLSVYDALMVALPVFD